MSRCGLSRVVSRLREADARATGEMRTRMVAQVVLAGFEGRVVFGEAYALVDRLVSVQWMTLTRVRRARLGVPRLE